MGIASPRVRCRACGGKVQGGSAVCQHCGAALSGRIRSGGAELGNEGDRKSDDLLGLVIGAVLLLVLLLWGISALLDL